MEYADVEQVLENDVKRRNEVAYDYNIELLNKETLSTNFNQMFEKHK